MRKIVAVLLTSLVALGVLAPAAGAHSRPPTVVDVLVQTSGTAGPDRNPFDFDLLIAAASNVVVPDSGGTTVAAFLASQPAVTVWAPNDAAFRSLARELGCSPCRTEAEVGAFLLGLDAATLFTVLAYHVTPGTFDVFAVLSTRTFDTLVPDADITRHGLRLQDLDGNDRDPWLTLPLNLRADNGVVHAITGVLRPIDLP